MNTQYLNIIGLILDLIGAIILTCGLIVNKKTALELWVSKWAGTTNSENLELPQVKDRIKQSRYALWGMGFIIFWFILQILSNF